MGALTPEQSIRLLRAKAAELENQLLSKEDRIGYLAADIALVAQLLADHIEQKAIPAHG